MWILHFLPDSIIVAFCNILLLLGIAAVVAGLFAHRIPVIWQYQLPFKVLGIALLAVGVYFRGGYAVEQQWRERVAEVEARLKVAESRSVEENTRIETRYVDRVKVIQQQGQEVIRYINNEVVKYDNTCVIPQEFVTAHNRAAEKKK